ncbi:Kurtz [Caligus rogercresseyi]|uniref:Kurtz n=1 Tax=Caligus rogercresseyi TaxID=217165 RepID=A0A7T8GXW3_CALRO|nr:Kurtz [Caligus rogercresseyi]
MKAFVGEDAGTNPTSGTRFDSPFGKSCTHPPSPGTTLRGSQQGVHDVTLKATPGVLT